MPDQRDEMDEALARISRATASIRPRERFSSRVRGAVALERDAVRRRAFLRAGRRTLLAAVALAAATIALAAERSHEIDEDVAASYGVEEVEW